ncbi:hypothetical protein LEP1GSC041_3613 [Leptospira noguchii str. 2006001870]|uniref:Uncharacterized protein n=1 Tax=Leptospira noguchii serovar Autumnalis str. ZUN142 TaxID=1085540 RepID=M6U378_9LEPT|nr:hypothetical protein LEP1GSC041_3613 [Leptospira noguchii str. 2006001870]EMO38945.1 hypothetical protein LEP1GSC186_0186 [Leptospira noguchii serovar Autumnalis str. ZUN142]
MIKENKDLLLQLGAPYQSLSQNLKELYDHSLEIFNKLQ